MIKSQWVGVHIHNQRKCSFSAGAGENKDVSLVHSSSQILCTLDPALQPSLPPPRVSTTGWEPQAGQMVSVPRADVAFRQALVALGGNQG